MNDFKLKAVSIIRNNSRGDFTIPCSHLYPFQWNWDSAFSALGIFTYDPLRAIAEIDKLFTGQWKNGMIPQIIFHNESNTYYPGPDVWESDTIPPTSCITQPPVLSTIIWMMIMFGYDNNEKLNEYFDKLMKYHVWYVENRDPGKKGIISIFHPWESGRDNSPDWDDALKIIEIDEDLIINRKDNSQIHEDLRPNNDDYNRYIQIINKCKELKWDNKEIYKKGIFNVCDPGVQFIFIKSCKDLYKMAIYLNKTEYYEIIESWIDLYSFGSNYLWNCKINAYSTLDLHTNKLFHGISCGAMLYGYADVGNLEQRKYMYEHSKRILYFSKYGFPSWDPNHIDFNSKKYWRGPIWCIINFMLAIGFKQTGQIDIMKKIKRNTTELIEKNGFFEYFDPYKGVGYGGNNFSWTAAIYLIFTHKQMI